MDSKKKINSAAELILAANRIVILTGAGISTASGIPDFRSSSGLWNQYNPEEVATLTVFKEDPKRFWGFYRERLDIPKEFDPNQAHYFIKKLEDKGKLEAVITQNIDGLHQKSGVSEDKVFEVHGSVRTLSCTNLHCQKEYTREAVINQEIPTCECGSVIKPDVVLFEEMLPTDATEKSRQALNKTDLLIVIGSSLLVEPVASYPSYAISAAPLIIINATPTRYEHAAAVWLDGDIVDNTTALLKRLGEEEG